MNTTQDKKKIRPGGFKDYIPGLSYLSQSWFLNSFWPSSYEPFHLIIKRVISYICSEIEFISDGKLNPEIYERLQSRCYSEVDQALMQAFMLGYQTRIKEEGKGE